MIMLYWSECRGTILVWFKARSKKGVRYVTLFLDWYTSRDLGAPRLNGQFDNTHRGCGWHSSGIAAEDCDVMNFEENGIFKTQSSLMNF